MVLQQVNSIRASPVSLLSLQLGGFTKLGGMNLGGGGELVSSTACVQLIKTRCSIGCTPVTEVSLLST